MKHIKTAAVAVVAATQIGSIFGMEPKTTNTNGFFSFFLSPFSNCTNLEDESQLDIESRANLRELVNIVKSNTKEGVQIDAQNKNFVNQDFTSVFSPSDLKILTINFSNSNLQESIFEGLNLHGCIFNGANIKRTNFKKTNLSDFDDENQLLAKWRNHPRYDPDYVYSDTSFKNADIEGAVFDGAKLDPEKLDEAKNKEKASIKNLIEPDYVCCYLK